MPVHLDEEEEDFEDVVDLETISDVNTRIGESQRTPNNALSDFFRKIQTNYGLVVVQALSSLRLPGMQASLWQVRLDRCV